MVRHLLFAFSVLLVSVPYAFTSDFCTDLLSSMPALKMKDTERLIAYLSDLLKHQVIGDEALLRLIQGLEQGKVVNPISDEETLLNSAAFIHRDGIQKYVEPHLDQKLLLTWAKESLSERKRVSVAREETRVVTQDPYLKMEFHPVVPAGSFMMGIGENRVSATLTHPFEMMSTVVTQNMWVKLMGENPSHHKKGDRTITVTINEKSIQMQPDHPVETITWWSAIVYANRLSIQTGLKPAYDLSGVEFQPNTSAEAGNLEIKPGEEDKIKINAPNENIYLAEGYRLPTQAEMEYVLKTASTANGQSLFEADEAALNLYAWHQGNSDYKIRPVAELNPLTLNGKDFYDLFGNVNERLHDRHAEKLEGGQDPQGAKTGDMRVMRCSSYTFKILPAQHFLHSDPKSTAWNTGFRLVRTIRNER